MTNTLTLIEKLDSPSTTRIPKEKLKPRRQRRKEMRDRNRAAKSAK